MTYRIGIDAGSKTLKIVVLDEAGDIVYSTYTRHRADIARTLSKALHFMNARLGSIEATVAVTGSAAIGIAEQLHLPFVQEVIATTHAVQTLFPQADCAIELGGEDAKVIYLTEGLEQRMNATCAGGTGGFIDTIAYMLDVRPSEMSQLALGASHIYPIASRCAVFAQTDVRPLLNAGASKRDIAASTFEAVARQTLGGLACGRPIRGTVVFLGGPFEHMPYLTQTFRKALDLTADTGIKPPKAHLVTAQGAAILSERESNGSTIMTAELEDLIVGMGDIEDDLDHLPPLFTTTAELDAFRARHAKANFPTCSAYKAHGPLYLGIDAGSTTLKLAVVNDARELVYNAYESIKGDMIDALRTMLGELYRTFAWPDYLTDPDPDCWIARTCATGYGEDLLRAAFGVDTGVVETAAHLRAAKQVCPDVTFLLDIGGQDMKALWIENGLVADVVLNEACSSGCGAFIEGTAAALKSSPWKFAREALRAKAPIDLGTKCTVFMNSRVKHAQKVGAHITDIAAGAAYSVVQNALYRIIGADRVASMGDRIVVQGGTFKSDAVLRAFEQLCGVEVTRVEQAHLMGAIGCALIAADEAEAIEPELKPLQEQAEPDGDPLQEHVGPDGDSVQETTLNKNGVFTLSTSQNQTTGNAENGVSAREQSQDEPPVESAVDSINREAERLALLAQEVYRERALKSAAAIKSGKASKTMNSNDQIVPDAETLTSAFSHNVSQCQSDTHSHQAANITLRGPRRFNVGNRPKKRTGGKPEKRLYNNRLRSELIGQAELAAIDPRQSKLTCTGCPNACQLTIVTFDDACERFYISNNKCERGLDELERRRQENTVPSLRNNTNGYAALGLAGAAAELADEKSSVPEDAEISSCLPNSTLRETDTSNTPPDLVAYEQALLASYTDTLQEGVRGQLRVGLMNALEMHVHTPFWHTLLKQLGFSLLLPTVGCELEPASQAWETVPSESVCYPAKSTHARYFDLAGKHADAVLMIRFDRGNHCPVSSEYARTLAINTSTVSGGSGDDSGGGRDDTENHLLPRIIDPLLINYKPTIIARDEASRASILEALNKVLSEALGDAYDETRAEPCEGTLNKVLSEARDRERCKDLITQSEFDAAMAAALKEQERFFEKLEQAATETLDWLHADPARHGIVLAGRPYHTDEALSYGMHRELQKLDFAVFSVNGLSQATNAFRKHQYEGTYPWKPAKRLLRTARFVAADPQLDLVFLQSFGCGFSALSAEEGKRVLDDAGKPFTVLKIDDIVDMAHLRIRLRTLANAIDMRKLQRQTGRSFGFPHEQAEESSDSPRVRIKMAPDTRIEKDAKDSAAYNIQDDLQHHPLDADDLELARRYGVKDACFTANALAARVIKELSENPFMETVELPKVCENCLTEAVPRIVERATGHTPEYTWANWQNDTVEAGASETARIFSRPRMGIVGNPLLCFDPFMNENIVDKLHALGCEPVLPSANLISVEDVRYVEQLKAFEAAGIRNVIYLMSFGCLKGHVNGRGALRELHRMFPNLRITVIDYDPESSALNRENRLRLAAEAARSDQ